MCPTICRISSTGRSPIRTRPRILSTIMCLRLGKIRTRRRRRCGLPGKVYLETCLLLLYSREALPVRPIHRLQQLLAALISRPGWSSSPAGAMYREGCSRPSSLPVRHGDREPGCWRRQTLVVCRLPCQFIRVACHCHSRGLPRLRRDGSPMDHSRLEEGRKTRRQRQGRQIR